MNNVPAISWQSQQQQRQELAQYPAAPTSILLGKTIPLPKVTSNESTTINLDESQSKNKNTAIVKSTDARMRIMIPSRFTLKIMKK